LQPEIEDALQRRLAQARKSVADEKVRNDSNKAREQKALLKHLQRCDAEAPAPRVTVDNTRRSLSMDHPDEAIGFKLLSEALGGTNPDFVSGLLRQLARATSAERLCEADLNFALSHGLIQDKWALKRYRTRGEQKVTVQHVRVNDGGQAIVGKVERGASRQEPETTVRALTDARQCPMPIIQDIEHKEIAIQRAEANDKQSHS
jgi:hypothetical protein